MRRSVMTHSDMPHEGAGRIADNIVYFARALRKAGLPVGPAAVIDAIRAVEAAGIGSRDDFYWTLHSVFVKKREHRDALPRGVRAVLAAARADRKDDRDAFAGRAAAAGREGGAAAAARRAPARRSALSRARDDKQPEIEIDARLTVSAREVLQRKDFAQMTRRRDRRGEARAGEALVLPDDRLKTRRLKTRRAWPHRSAPHHARVAEGRRRHHHAGVPRARRGAAADRRALRHLRLDEPIFPADAAFPARALRAPAGAELSSSARGSPTSRGSFA